MAYVIARVVSSTLNQRYAKVDELYTKLDKRFNELNQRPGKVRLARNCFSLVVPASRL